MQTLRSAHLLARLVLVWFALAIGVAVASPLVNPQGIELVCSAGGMTKLLVKSDDGGKSASGATLDCPLCMPMDAPPPALHGSAQSQLPSSEAPQEISAGRLIVTSAGPSPGRGPPQQL